MTGMCRLYAGSFTYLPHIPTYGCVGSLDMDGRWKVRRIEVLGASGPMRCDFAAGASKRAHIQLYGTFPRRHNRRTSVEYAANAGPCYIHAVSLHWSVNTYRSLHWTAILRLHIFLRQPGLATRGINFNYIVL